MVKYLVIENSFNDGESNREKHLFDTEEQAYAKFNEIKDFYRKILPNFSEEKSTIFDEPYVRKNKKYFQIRSTEYNYHIYLSIRKKEIE